MKGVENKTEEKETAKSGEKAAEDNKATSSLFGAMGPNLFNNTGVNPPPIFEKVSLFDGAKNGLFANATSGLFANQSSGNAAVDLTKPPTMGLSMFSMQLAPPKPSDESEGEGDDDAQADDQKSEEHGPPVIRFDY